MLMTPGLAVAGMSHVLRAHRELFGDGGPHLRGEALVVARQQVDMLSERVSLLSKKMTSPP